MNIDISDVVVNKMNEHMKKKNKDMICKRKFSFIKYILNILLVVYYEKKNMMLKL